ncbi:pre-mRNA 3'-end-processing factor FIP1 isoform X2 [Anabas testudineus]|uniref:Pre-mRNA polyadenylation factor Fip1 domain-containing protein n=1 Tax=Anabas testudineus TaxID=64144 RepID=A0A7N5ZY03_ANATE|nr:pre-mRNA 3'-end-processing factor FIP1 isoform X2 [Anabas testudineus]
MSSESDSKVAVEDDEEKKIYQLIYEMHTIDDREMEEATQSSSSSSEHSPVQGKINSESSLHAVVSTANESNMDAVDNMQEIPVQKVNLESIEEKPWRKAGADISDYFNYGFDEESWNTYCTKQTKLRAASTKQKSVQKGHNRHGEEQLCCAYSSSASSFTLASRESSPLINVIGGRPGCSRSVEGHRCLDEKGNNTQTTEISSEEDRITSYHPTPPSNFGSLFSYVCPPPFLYRKGPPPPSPTATLDSGHRRECHDPSTLQNRFSSGTELYSTGLTNTAKAWENYILQEKCNKDRSRDHGQEKNSKRGRDRQRWSCSSHNSGEEHTRHRDTVEQGHRRHSFEGDNGEKEEWSRGRRRNSEKWQQSSCSSRSRSGRDDGEDRKSQNRQSHKKRNGKDNMTNKIFSSDNEEK